MNADNAVRRPSTYPIMLTLDGADVLVVGGGVIGERRVAGLLEADARVTLVAPFATPALAELARAGRLRWETRLFDTSDVAGRALTFAATGIAEVDEAVASAARDAAVLVNAADDLARCDFHVPAVARRGDIVIAVGTSGAAPALAARLRDRFAASLGPEWERFVALLGAMRVLARERITDGAERMRVLARASRDDRLLSALSRGAEVDAATALDEAQADAAGGPVGRDGGGAGTTSPWSATWSENEPRRARVSLVGTGPGAPDLLTLRAGARVREADVIVYDDLVDRRVLAQASPRAELVYCGKRGWRPGPHRPGPELLVERALEGAGKHVVRLKGGDPGVFGRLAEEIAALENAGVPYEIVPGVTAGLAAAAAARIPLTERGVSGSVTLVTGATATTVDGATEQASPTDIARLVAAGGTVAVYMGLRLLPEIVEGLGREGVCANLPVAVVGAVSTAEESLVRGTIANIAARVARAAPASPALVVIGEVARQRPGVSTVNSPAAFGSLPTGVC